jgi:antitoxin CptB
MMINADKKAKINWRCRRGMLELDLILGRFAKNYVDSLTEQQFLAFEKLLMEQDPDIYAWLMGYEEPVKEFIDIVTFIRANDRI